MSHTISARKEQGFLVEVRDFENRSVHSGWYQDRDEAQAVASHWERLVTWKLVDGLPAPTMHEIMSDDELLAELVG
jgi:hypothetical protein